MWYRMESFNNLEESLNQLSELKPKDYGVLVNFGKSQKSLSVLPSVMMDHENFAEFLNKFMINVGPFPALTMVLGHKKPSKDDKSFQKLIRKKLADGLEEESQTLLRELSEAINGFETAQKTLVSYLLQCAGKDRAFSRSVLKSPSDPVVILRELIQENKKTSSNSAINLKATLYATKMKANWTMTELIEELEHLKAQIEEAGGTVELHEMAALALKVAKEHSKTTTDTAAYITQLHRESKEPDWPDVKAFLKALDRTMEETATPSVPSIAAAVLPGQTKNKKDKGPFCKSCNGRHPYGQHTKTVDRALVAAVVAQINHRGGRGGHGGRGGGRVGGRGGGRSHRTPYEQSQGRYVPFQGTCDLCGRYGHKKADCYSNPDRIPGDRSSNLRGYGYTGNLPVANYMERRNEDYRSETYDSVLDRASKRTAWVLFGPAVALALSTNQRDKYKFIIDSGATQVYAWESQHRFEPTRLISTTVSTAGNGHLTSVREGFLGNIPAVGMSDELTVQLFGACVLIKMGYIIIWERWGALIRSPRVSIETSYTSGLLYIDIRSLPEFNEPFNILDHHGTWFEPPATPTIE